MPTVSAVLHRDLHTPPHNVLSAAGHYLTFAPVPPSTTPRLILDATGGAAVSCIGHANPRVLAAISAQAQTLSYCHSMFFSHPVGEALATFLAKSTGGKMPLSLILGSGSEVMESALKLSRQYFVEKGEGNRTRFIARRESYHGNSLGALGVGGHATRREKYLPLLAENTSFISPCNAYRGKFEGESDESYVGRLKSELEEEFLRVGPERVCAFVAEPVVGAAAGCVPAVKGYFVAVKEVCEKYGALLILDEVMSGMGRCSTLHAWQQEGVVPDLQTIGKGLAGGYQPAAAVLVGEKVADVLTKGSGKFANGHTYQAGERVWVDALRTEGHPLVCAASLEVQKIIEEEHLLDNVRAMGAYLEVRLREVLGDHPHVGDIRGKGLFWGLELVEDRITKAPFPVSLGLAMAIHDEALTQEPGVMLYPGQGCVDGRSGDQILIAPPYTITKDEIDLIVNMAKKSIDIAVAAAKKSSKAKVHEVVSQPSN